jgi:SagB-type dehydrogenase family enzyme
MKDNTITEKIESFVRHFKKISLSEDFHNKTKIFDKGKTTPRHTWPESWKSIYIKGYPRLKQIYLDKNLSMKMHSSLNDALYNRKSTRVFDKKILTKNDISTLLFYSAGVKSMKGNDWDSSRRFYPSGGARYPLDIYVVLYNNTEIEKGVYHYNVKRHTLELLKKGNYLNEIKAGLDKKLLKNTNMAILITSVFGRNQIKYGDRGYRFILQESGHLGQNIYLTAAALNIGCCALGGYVDSVINDLLDIDGINESVVYSFIIGFPKQQA